MPLSPQTARLIGRYSQTVCRRICESIRNCHYSFIRSNCDRQILNGLHPVRSSAWAQVCHLVGVDYRGYVHCESPKFRGLEVLEKHAFNFCITHKFVHTGVFFWFFFNIIPAQSEEVRRFRLHPVTQSLAIAFTTMNVIGLISLRIYLLWKSKPIESLLKDIQDCGSQTLGRGQNHGRETSILLLFGLTIVTGGAVGFSDAMIAPDKRQSWFYWMGDYP